MSACLSATEDKRQKVEMSSLVYISSALYYVPSLTVFYTNCVMPSLVCPLFFLFLFRLCKAKRERENDDHHIIFVVTIEVGMRAYSSLCRQTYIVRSRPSLSVSYIYIYFVCLICKRTALIIFYAFLIGHW